MKKLFFAAAIMMASVVSAFAQHEAGDITLQARVGMIGADFNNTSDTKARVGLVIGPEMEYFLTNRFSLGAGVLYSQQGAEQDKADVTYELDYINMPITANFYVVKGLALRVGLQPGFNVSSTIKAVRISSLRDRRPLHLRSHRGLRQEQGRSRQQEPHLPALPRLQVQAQVSNILNFSYSQVPCIRVLIPLHGTSLHPLSSCSRCYRLWPPFIPRRDKSAPPSPPLSPFTESVATSRPKKP